MFNFVIAALIPFQFLTTLGDDAYGIDVSTSTSSDSWSCMAEYGYSYSIVRGYLSYGEVDTNVIGTLEAAADAGIEYRDIYMFPCRGLDASDQMEELIEYLNDNNFISQEDYNYVWLDLESNPKTSCYWSSYDADSNCEYVQEMIDTAESYDVKIGIYSSTYNWELIFDSTTNCQDFTDYPLWYAHYDDDPSFDDWDDYQFGGWDSPSMKQYVGDDTLCSTGIDKNYADSSFFDDYYSGTSTSTSDGTGTSTTDDSDCSNPQTAGDVSVEFDSGETLTSVASCDDNYEDPNDMGVYLFSESASGSDTYLSDNFQVSEFVSPDGDDKFRVSPLLVECLQSIREEIGEILYVKEAYRTVSYNTDNGGASASYHLSGTAAEIYGYSEDILTVADAAICNCWSLFTDNGYSIGLGLGSDFIDVGFRDTYGYWVEDGASKSGTEWNEYITDVYDECSSTQGTGDDDDSTDTTTDDDDSINDDGTIAFPNVDLTPYSSSSSDYDDPNDSGTYLFSASEAGSSTYLSDNFQVNEFTCNDGSDGFRLSPKLVECLQAVRDDLGVSISINSGYRTVSYNSYVGGATYSRHQSGTAADIQQYSVDIMDFAYSVICQCRSIFINHGQEIGLGLGASYLHVDMRPYYSYWTYSGASLSSSSWNSYISSTYDDCSTTASANVVLASSYYYGSQYSSDGNETADGNGTASYVSQDDVHDSDYDDIDDEENTALYDVDVSSDGDGSDIDGGEWIDDNWWVILLIVVLFIGVAAVVGCKWYQKRKDSGVNMGNGSGNAKTGNAEDTPYVALDD